MHPSFTIVIPTCGRRAQLASCLRAIAALDYPRDRFSVVVVDDGSGDPPRAEVEHAAVRIAATLVCRDRNGGPGAARNTGVERASGDYVAFLGDDCEPAGDWLRALARRLHGTSDLLVGGAITNGLPDNAFSSASDHLIQYLYGHYNRDPERARFFTPNNMAVPPAMFRALGGFDESMGWTGEDRELCDRWFHQGGRLVYAPDVTVRHTHPLTFRDFWDQQVRYGRGTYKYRLRQRGPRAGAVAPEPLAFYGKLVLSPLRSGLGIDAWIQSGLLAASQVATSVGILLEMRRQRR